MMRVLSHYLSWQRERGKLHWVNRNWRPVYLVAGRWRFHSSSLLSHSSKLTYKQVILCAQWTSGPFPISVPILPLLHEGVKGICLEGFPCFIDSETSQSSPIIFQLTGLFFFIMLPVYSQTGKANSFPCISILCPHHANFFSCSTEQVEYADLILSPSDEANQVPSFLSPHPPKS